jgi:hypothetical protein
VTVRLGAENWASLRRGVVEVVDVKGKQPR